MSTSKDELENLAERWAQLTAQSEIALNEQLKEAAKETDMAWLRGAAYLAQRSKGKSAQDAATIAKRAAENARRGCLLSFVVFAALVAIGMVV